MKRLRNIWFWYLPPPPPEAKILAQTLVIVPTMAETNRKEHESEASEAVVN